MKYYKFGIPSWDWYYPFHQAPHLSDLIYIIRQVNVNKFKFKKNVPLKTFEQLLAVLPSKACIWHLKNIKVYLIVAFSHW